MPYLKSLTTYSILRENVLLTAHYVLTNSLATYDWLLTNLLMYVLLATHNSILMLNIYHLLTHYIPLTTHYLLHTTNYLLLTTPGFVGHRWYVWSEGTDGHILSDGAQLGRLTLVHPTYIQMAGVPTCPSLDRFHVQTYILWETLTHTSERDTTYLYLGALVLGWPNNTVLV